MKVWVGLCCLIGERRRYDILYEKKNSLEEGKKAQNIRGWAFCPAILACHVVSSKLVWDSSVGSASDWFHQKVRRVGFSV
jgi:hypothetical protein